MIDKSLLPNNASQLLKDLEKAGSGVSRLNIMNSHLNNSTTCPEEFLPWLGWAVSVDIWDETWAIDIRRDVIKNSFEVHKKKGTLGALKDALSSFKYAKTTIEEWFEYDGKPYMFRVFLELISDGVNLRQINDVYDVIIQTKNVRSWLENLTVLIKTSDNNPFLGNIIADEEIISIYGEE